jgi:hypothetical protein
VRCLQVAVLIAGCVPVSAGLAGVLGGPALFGGGASDISLDSHMRYLSGLLLGIGLAFWSFVPRITTVTAACRLLTFLVFVGGLGRLVSLIGQGVPSHGMLLGLAMELVVTPALCWWQGRIATDRP